MVSAAMSVCVGAHLCLCIALPPPSLSSRPQRVRYGRVILTWCKSLSFTADKSRLVSGLCAGLEADARCLYATTMHGHCPSMGRTPAGSIHHKILLEMRVNKK